MKSNEDYAYQYAKIRGLNDTDAHVFAYLWVRRFKDKAARLKHRILQNTIDVNWTDYEDEWLERIKYKRFYSADSTTLKIWKNAIKKYGG